MAAERLGASNWHAPWLRHQHVARYRWVLPFIKDRRVLDAACGTAYGSRLMAHGGAHSILGIDLSEETIEHVRKRNTFANLSFLTGDATRLPVDDESFDAYISFETIEHVEDDAQYVREALRVVRSGGVFICSTPNRHVTNPGKSISDKPNNPFHVREYALDDLVAILKTCFQAIEIFGQTQFSANYCSILARIGAMNKSIAFRGHQICKTMNIPWESFRRHWPQRQADGHSFETLIAVCTKE